MKPQEIEVMSGTISTIIIILLIIGILYLSFRLAGWRMKKAWDFIIRDLNEKKAFDPASAVQLPYAKTPMLRRLLGMRDYRPQALRKVMQHDVVRVLEGERYYLRDGHKLDGVDDRTAA